MVVRAAKKTAAPAKKAVSRPAVKTAPKAAPTPVAKKPTPEPKSVAPKLTAHDVLRARAAADKAKAMADELERQYWAQNEAELDDAAAAGAAILETEAPARKTGRKPAETPSAKARATKPVAGEFYDLDKVSAMGIKEVRELATDLAEKGLITETKLKKEIIKQMTDAGLFRETGSGSADDDDAVDDDETLPEDSEEFDEEDDSEDDDDAEESDDDDEDESDEDDDDEDSDDEDGEGYSLEELKAMTLDDLQELAEENGVDVDGMSKKQIVAALWEQAQEAAEGDDEDDDDEDDEEDEEESEEVLEIDLDELPEWTIAQLLDLAAKTEVKIPVSKKKNKDWIVEKLTEELGGEEDDEDEDDE
jgi:hypothetical protein